MGDSGVGKTTLIHSFVNNEFCEDFKSTIGADFSSKVINVDNTSIDLQIWDTAGEERFHSVGAAFYRGTDACLLVYDITQKNSFERVEVWLNDLLTKANVTNSESFPIVLFGNKSDLAEELRSVSTEDAENWAKLKNCGFYEVSAKTQNNVENGFQEVLRKFIKNHDRVIMNNPNGLKLTFKPEKKSRDCC